MSQLRVDESSSAQQVVTSLKTARQRNLWPFLVWVCVFYGCWLALVTINDDWDRVRENWGIAVAMLLGSYVAGSTPMGGGTVGFPVLVLLFEFPSSIGRNFGLAIQSVGMVSASIYILCSRTIIASNLVWPTLLGALVSMPLSAAIIAPVVSDLAVKLVFAVVWASFGLLHFAKLSEFVNYTGVDRWSARHEWWVGIATGCIGGVLATLTGVGIDMLLYVVLVLLFRCDLKIAIPSSVIVMAFASVLGTLSNLALAYALPDRFIYAGEVYYSWLAAAPVVILGAPFGALVVERVSRTKTLIFVSGLCLLQFVWTAVHEQLNPTTLAISLVGIALFNIGFYGLYRIGRAQRTA